MLLFGKIAVEVSVNTFASSFVIALRLFNFLDPTGVVDLVRFIPD